MQLLLCFALALPAFAAPHVPRVHSVKLPPMPAAYQAWHPDPNELKDVMSGKKSLLHTHSRKHKGHGNATSFDDDDLDMSNLFKVREPKQTFKMDEASTILYNLLGQYAKPSYLQYAATVAKEHKLSDAKQAALVASLRQNLQGFQKGGHDFMLDAARASHPELSEKQQRERLVSMLQVMLKNATTAVPPKATSAHARKLAHKSLNFAAKAKLDINQKVYIENQLVLGDSAGEGALGVCRGFAQQHVDNPAAPTVKVCGTGIKMTAYLLNECKGYYEHSKQIGKCDTGMPPSTCDTFSPANDERFGHYQSYMIEMC